MGKKILFVDNLLWSVVNFRGFIIRRLRDEGYRVVLVAPKEGEYGKTINYLPEGVRFIPVKMDRCGTNPFHDFAYFRTLLKIYRKERPDYIFHYTIKPNIYGTVAASSLGIPCTSLIAGLGYAFSEGGFSKHVAAYLYKKAIRHATKVFTLSEDNYNFLLSNGICLPDRTIWLHGGEGVDLKAYPFMPNAGEPPRFLLVGRMLADKGYYEFVEAARIVRTKHPEVHFQLLGTVDPSYPLNIPLDRIYEDVDSGAVEYLGTTDNIQAEEGKRGTVVVLPSYHEGMSRALMEALSMGKPVITTDIPGCRETVEEGKNGFLVPKRDGKALAEACFRYISLSAEQKEAFSLHSRKMAEEIFDIEKVYVEYKKVLTESIGK